MVVAVVRVKFKTEGLSLFGVNQYSLEDIAGRTAVDTAAVSQDVLEKG